METEVKRTSLAGKKISFVLVESCLTNNGSGKACSLGSGLDFHLVHKNRVSIILPCAGMSAQAAEAWALTQVAVATKAAYKQPCLVWGGKSVPHDIPMTTWVHDGGKATAKADALDGTVTVTVAGHFDEFGTRQKLAGDGVKGVAVPEPSVKVFSASSGEDLSTEGLVVFTAETVKGKQALASATAEWMAKEGHGQFVYDPNVGYTESHLAWMGKYYAASSQLVDLVYPVEKYQYGILAGLYGEDPAWSFMDNGVVVHRCRAVFGEMVLAVEYTSTFQNVDDRQELMPEMVYLRDLIDPVYAETLWANPKAARRRKAIGELLDMLQFQPDGNVPGWTVCPVKGVKFDVTVSDAEIAKKLVERYPLGFTLTWEAYSQYVNPRVLLDLGAYSPGGESYGFAHELIALLRWLHRDNVKVGDPTQRMRAGFRKFKASLKATLSKSRKTLAQALRCGKLLGRKIDTTYRIGMGLWELHVNPADYVVGEQLSEGDVVLLSRVPVLNGVPFKVVLDPLTPLGVFQVHPLCWHAANEGDVDGDGCVAERVKREMATSVWKKFHDATTGGWRGYFLLRGADPDLFAPGELA